MKGGQDLASQHRAGVYGIGADPLDSANYKKPMNQLVELLPAVDGEVEMGVRERPQNA